MNLLNTVTNTQKPDLYAAGSSIMWTDSHISKQLLEVHLHPELDLASRKATTITQTVEWILDQVPSNEKLDILDLGCGPGLYCEQFAEKGHRVTGVDFSENSIEYAQQSAREKELSIEYIQGNYCELDLGENRYDLVIQIFTDLGVLHPNDRKLLLTKMRKALKPGGVLIFDLMAESALKSQLSPKEWELSPGGFWRPGPYLHVGETVLYEEEKVILSQHVVMEESDTGAAQFEIYRFWTHYFNSDEIRGMVARAGFVQVEVFENIIPDSTFCEGEDVLFTKAVKE